MPRPKFFRRINFNPGITYFKPRGIPMAQLEEVNLSLDEIEALRLKYHLNHDNQSGAKEMKISSSTFQRLLVSALQKTTDALINGKAIQLHSKIDFNFPERRMNFRCGRQRRGRCG